MYSCILLLLIIGRPLLLQSELQGVQKAFEQYQVSLCKKVIRLRKKWIWISNQLHTQNYSHIIIFNIASINYFNDSSSSFGFSDGSKSFCSKIIFCLLNSILHVNRYWFETRKVLSATWPHKNANGMKSTHVGCHIVDLSSKFQAAEISYQSSGSFQKYAVFMYLFAEIWSSREVYYLQ